MELVNIINEERTFGVEIEFYGVRASDVVTALNKKENIIAAYEGYTHRTTPHWKVVTDSSVDEEGLELVSPVLKGQDGVDQLNKVCEALQEVGAKVNKSCGLHIHLDARDLTLQDWKNTLVFYRNYQRSINKMLPRSRRNNSYCDSYGHGELKRILEAKTLDELFDKARNRYKTINLCSFLRHGTIEFRQHSGTVEFEKIAQWLQFCMASVEKGKSVKNLYMWRNEDDSKEFEALMTQLRKVGAPKDAIAYYRNRNKELNECA